MLMNVFKVHAFLEWASTFDDTDTSGNLVFRSMKLHELIRRDARNAERIFPYIGGREINSDPQQTASSFVIDFGDMSLEEALRWPLLLEIVRSRVKPGRDQIGGYSVADRRREHWWQFGTATPALK